MPRQNKGPYLSDRPNSFGFFEVCWTEDGRSKRKSTGTGDRRAAQRFYAEFLLAASGEDVGPGGVTIGQCIDAYLADKKGVAAPNTQRNDYGHLKAHFGDILVAELDDDDVTDYLDAREAGHISFTDAEGKLRGGCCAKDSTVRRELTMLSTAVRHCIKKKKFKGPDGQPLLKVIHQPVIELPPAPQPRDRWLRREEASALLAAALEHIPASGEDPARLPRVYRYVAVMLYTASRKTPVIRLTWDRIQLQLDPAKVEQGDYGLINFRAPGEPVTKKRRGWVPIGAELYPILKRAFDERISEYFLDEPIQPKHQFAAAAKRAGLYDPVAEKPTVSPHVLRHTWGCWAAQDGVSLYQIAQVMHDTVATVEKHYLHHCPEHLRGAVNRRMLEAA